MNSSKPSRSKGPSNLESKNARPANADPRRHVWAAEAIGLVIITLLILVYALLRYGRSIPWNAR